MNTPHFKSAREAVKTSFFSAAPITSHLGYSAQVHRKKHENAIRFKNLKPGQLRPVKNESKRQAFLSPVGDQKKTQIYEPLVFQYYPINQETPHEITVDESKFKITPMWDVNKYKILGHTQELNQTNEVLQTMA